METLTENRLFGIFDLLGAPRDPLGPWGPKSIVMGRGKKWKPSQKIDFLAFLAPWGPPGAPWAPWAPGAPGPWAPEAAGRQPTFGGGPGGRSPPGQGGVKFVMGGLPPSRLKTLNFTCSGFWCANAKHTKRQAPRRPNVVGATPAKNHFASNSINYRFGKVKPTLLWRHLQGKPQGNC